MRLISSSSSLVFRQHSRTAKIVATTNKQQTGTITPIRTFLLCFEDLRLSVVGHCDNPSTLPHNPEFPIKDLADAFWKTLPVGIGPVKSLYEKSKECRLIMVDSESGILPERWLCETLRFSNIESFPKFEGMVPESELLLRSSKYRKFKLPSSKGISPERLLWLKSKLDSFS
jgi:hypothetical protein